MIEEIEIIINSNPTNELDFLLNIREEKCYINNQEKRITNKDIEKIKELILFLDSNESKSTIIDQEKCLIRIKTKDEEEQIIINNNYSNNYILLKEIIGEINER